MGSLRATPLLFLIVLAGSLSQETARQQNSTDAAPRSGCAGDELSLVVAGAANASGQPLVQARLEQPAGRPPWRLDVRLRDLPCSPGEAARRVLVVAVHGPNGGSPLPTPERLQQLPDPSINDVEAIETFATAQDVSQSDQPRRYGGYSKVANIGRYKLHETPANWSRAAGVCTREGATLAVPNSQREADALWQVKQGGRTARGGNPRARGAFGLTLAGMERVAFLVGARRAAADQNFTTIFGEPLSEAGFGTWATAPQDGEDCTALYSNTGFFAVPCETELAFVCELPL